MKKTLFLIYILLIGFSFIQAQTRSFKRGVGFNNLLTGDVKALSPGLSWGYNWGQTGSGNDAAFTEYGVEFIPMAWNNTNPTAVRALLQKHPEIKYILGFNEPNFTDQANLTPTQAAERWPALEAIADEFNLTIVGPAVNYSPNPPYQDPIKWYDEFFEACVDCRVDHIAVHFYMPSGTAIKSSVDKFKKYGKPIWLTEFCAWETSTTAVSQAKLMVEIFDLLETDPDVYRYAWFKERGWSGGFPHMQLLDRRLEGVLTPLGEIFTYMSSYDDNFYFTASQKIPSEHYIRMKGISLEKTSDVSDHLNIMSFDAPNDWVDYNVDIPEAGEYNVFFRYADEYGDASEVAVSVNGVEKASMIFEGKGIGVWATQSVKANFDAGKQKIRVYFKRGGLKLNWWEITKNEVPSSVNKVELSNISIYPNPVTDVLNIATVENQFKVSVFDVSGRIIHAVSNEKTINTSDWKSGVYMVQIDFNNGQKQSFKIVK